LAIGAGSCMRCVTLLVARDLAIAADRAAGCPRRADPAALDVAVGGAAVATNGRSWHRERSRPVVPAFVGGAEAVAATRLHAPRRLTRAEEVRINLALDAALVRDQAHVTLLGGVHDAIAALGDAHAVIGLGTDEPVLELAFDATAGATVAVAVLVELDDAIAA